MKLTYLNEENFEPEDFTTIDKEHSIVFAIPTYYNNVSNNDDFVFISNTHSFQPNSLKMSNENLLIYNFKPQIKLLYPKGVIFNFKELPTTKPIINIVYPILDRIRNYDSFNISNHLSFTVYIDKLQIKKYETSLIDINQFKIAIDYQYSIFAENEVENIYIINNTFVFSDFEKHFCG